jgi:hypothetical protein
MRYVHVFFTRWHRASRTLDSFQVYQLTIEDPTAFKVACRLSEELRKEVECYDQEIRSMLLRQRFNADIDGPYVIITHDPNGPLSRQFIEALAADTDYNLEDYRTRLYKEKKGANFPSVT